MKLTIGMAGYNNYPELWFTLQALRMYQDLDDVELLVVDQSEDSLIERWAASWGRGKVRVIHMTEPKGTAAPRDRVFKEAKGRFTICIDSHVLLAPGSIGRFKAWAAANDGCLDLLQGPMMYDSLDAGCDRMREEWRASMYGTWAGSLPPADAEPYEIRMMGLGLFGCRTDAWLGFLPDMRGFGGEEGFIHERYRTHGRKTLCLPFLRWSHFFRPGAPPYPLKLEERIRNYELGWRYVGLDLQAMRRHFNIPAGGEPVVG